MNKPVTHTVVAWVQSCARGPGDLLDFQVEGTSPYITLDSGEKPVKEMNVRVLDSFLGKTPELCFRGDNHCCDLSLSVADRVGSAHHGFREHGGARGRPLSSFPVTLLRKL